MKRKQFFFTLHSLRVFKNQNKTFRKMIFRLIQWAYFSGWHDNDNFENLKMELAKIVDNTPDNNLRAELEGLVLNANKYTQDKEKYGRMGLRI